MFAQQLPNLLKKRPQKSKTTQAEATSQTVEKAEIAEVTPFDANVVKETNLKAANLVSGYVDGATPEQVKEREAKEDHRKEVHKKFRDAVKRATYIHRWFESNTPNEALKEQSPTSLKSETKLSYAGEVNANGVYKITLSSQSNIGVFESEGTAIIAKLPDNSYEIKAFFDPNKPKEAPWYAITLPYYIHAIAREGSDENTFLCSGKVYVQKSIMYKVVTKVVEGNDVEVKFGEAIGGKNNTYEFSQNPITLFGASPGKMTNTGKLTKVSDKIEDAELDKAWADKNLDAALNLPNLRR